MRKHALNLRRDAPDKRDLLFRAPASAPTPDVVDWRKRDIGAFYQGTIGCCCEVVTTMNWHFQMHLQRKNGFSPSVLFLYYNSRKRLGPDAVKKDCGSTIRDSFKTLAAVGVCRDTLWPFIVQNLFLEPPPSCYEEAARHRAIAYERIEPDAKLIELALSIGRPVAFGMLIFNSLETREVAASGIMPMPDESKDRCIGGHAMRIVGYNRPNKQFIVANSWGPLWGLNGYFLAPYDAVMKYGSDFWTLSLVT